MFNIISIENSKPVITIQKKLRQFFAYLQYVNEKYKHSLKMYAEIYLSLKIGIILFATFFAMGYLTMYISKYIAVEMTKWKAIIFTLPLAFIIVLKLFFIFKVLILCYKSRLLFKVPLEILFRKMYGTLQVDKSFETNISSKLRLSVKKIKN